MHFKYHLIFIIAVFISLLTTNAVSGDERAAKKFEMAISACEKGLQMKMPKSKGALIILQNLFKKYQRHRDAALKLDESLKSSEEKRYTGSFFARKPFSEVYQTCEHDFSEKVAAAETTVKKTAENIESLQIQQDATLTKTTAANQEVVLAIDNYCATYLLKPEGTSSPWYSKYQTTKQKALEIYPDIVNQFHATTITEIGTGKSTNLNKTIKAWFDYCDAAFVQPVETAKPPVASEANPPAQEPSSPESDSGATLPPKTIVTPPQEGETTPVQPIETTTPSPKATDTTPASTPVSEKEVNPIQTTGPTSSPETAKTPAPESAPTPSPATNITTPPQEDAVSAGPTPDKDKTDSIPTTDSSNAKDIAFSSNPPSPAESDNADTDEAEYKSVMAKMQGDRLKVLKEEKRLPDFVDFVDDEDYNYQKATTWQYEKADGKRCSIYNFKENKLVKTNKNLAGACPPFSTKE